MIIYISCEYPKIMILRKDSLKVTVYTRMVFAKNVISGYSQLRENKKLI